MNVETRRLTADVPMRCAKTGVPTTLARRTRLPVWRRISYWWLLVISPGLWGLIVLARTRWVPVVLPISADVRRRHNKLRLARAAGAVVVLAAPYIAGTPLVLLVAAPAWWLLHRATRSAWVRPRCFGTVTRLDAHSDFGDALRGVPAHAALVPTVRQVPDPGWYPDPSGQHLLRFWDGDAWTEQVNGTPAGAMA